MILLIWVSKTLWELVCILCSWSVFWSACRWDMRAEDLLNKVVSKTQTAKMKVFFFKSHVHFPL